MSDLHDLAIEKCNTPLKEPRKQMKVLKKKELSDSFAENGELP